MKAIIWLISASTLAFAQVPDYYFPDSFVFGVATAAYQIEGGWDADGKGESIWDHDLHETPNRTADNQNGDISCDSYHKYKDDVQLMKDLGVQYYRFSISWSRILPTGKADNINQAGLDYYNNLIDELLANDILPYVTMFHWDLPQALQEEYGGWVNRTIADHFVDYARILFVNFGDRVKHWMTFNEIMQICEGGYGGGGLAPFIQNEGVGDYECTHTVLLAHGMTFRMYDTAFREEQGGQIGAAIDTSWHEPNNPSDANDQQASLRSLLMGYGWFIEPIIRGNYPDVMIERIAYLSLQQGYSQSRLPQFTEEEQAMLRGSFDFIGLNHYTTDVVYMNDEPPGPDPSHWSDVGVISYADPTWPSGASTWLKVVPWGIYNLLVWIKNEYGNPPIIITENGFSDRGQLDDYNRADYIKDYLFNILKAMHGEGCNVIGYTVWSLIDNFEWTQGYTEKFGLHYVDFEDPERPRTKKLSSYVYNNIITTRHIDWEYYPDWPPSDN